MIVRVIMFFLTSFTVSSFGAIAWAGLGDDLSQAPRDLENSTEISSKFVGTNVIEKTVATSSTVLREYADNAGFVFAVTWTGVRPPDLRNILGSSRWNEYNTTARDF